MESHPFSAMREHLRELADIEEGVPRGRNPLVSNNLDLGREKPLDEMLSICEGLGAIPFYLPGTRDSGVVHPVQLLLTELGKCIGGQKEKGFGRSVEGFEAGLIGVSRNLCFIDPEQRGALSNAMLRDSIDIWDYTERARKSYGFIGEIPTKFYLLMEEFFGIVREIGDEKKAVVAGIPVMTAGQEEVIKNYGLYHPRLFYLAESFDPCFEEGISDSIKEMGMP